MYTKKTKKGFVKSVYLILSFNLLFASSSIMAFSAKKFKAISSLDFSQIESISNAPNSQSNSDESPWTLGYSDNKIKVYYQKVVCDGKDSYRLWISNLTNSKFNISYKLWSSVEAKVIEINPFANMEGICSSGYGYKMVEVIPNTLKKEKINLIINYLQ